MGSIFGELTLEGVAVVVFDVDAELPADPLQLAELVADLVGAVEIPVEFLVIAPVEADVDGAVELLIVELMTQEADLGSVLDI